MKHVPVRLLFPGAEVGHDLIDAVRTETAAEAQNHGAVSGVQLVKLFEGLEKEKGFAPGENLVVTEYINNMPQLLAAADLVIARSGALTLAELEAVGRASVLIPSPNVAENHQYYNALELQKAGAAVVIEEKNLTGDGLVKTVETLLTTPGCPYCGGTVGRRSRLRIFACGCAGCGP